MHLEKYFKTSSNKLFSYLASSCCGDLTIESISLRGTSILYNLGKSYKRGLIQLTGLIKSYFFCDISFIF